MDLGVRLQDWIFPSFLNVMFKDSRDKEFGVKEIQTKLSPLYKDNVTEWLPLQSQCKFRLPVRRGIANSLLPLRPAQHVLHEVAQALGAPAEQVHNDCEHRVP